MILDILIWAVAGYAVLTVLYLIFGRNKKTEETNDATEKTSIKDDPGIKEYFAKKRRAIEHRGGEFEIISSARMMEDNEPSAWEFEIEYEDSNGNKSTRYIRNVLESPDGSDTMLYAECSLTGEHRTFRSSRIQRCINIKTGRAIKDLGTYLRKGYGWR